MSDLNLSICSPLAEYLDEDSGSNTLAQRPASLEGKVVGLLPNWRPSAVDLLRTVGTVISERCRTRAVVLEQAVSEVPMNTSRLLDALNEKLADLAARVDVVVTASGD
ncbi:MAG: hypothetical protein HY322_17235 [Betaproteobacteria bacterium]|nr:hypothetical protein [Betaproteobacteria bacterium]